MKLINALRVRTKFGQVMEELKRAKEPFLLTRDGQIEAALVPIKMFNERFVDLLGKSAVEKLIADLAPLQGPARSKTSSQTTLRALRGQLK
ncbi:MAG: hypothetical protein HYR96_01950 [Deltaproteobacteria bacterium]|nr:hypothetical protein [Deltaproteobacteria bacterium]MBI3295632.1 hypothetical protein [Deltaproteobacteria bacterium]